MYVPFLRNCQKQPTAQDRRCVGWHVPLLSILLFAFLIAPNAWGQEGPDGPPPGPPPGGEGPGGPDGPGGPPQHQGKAYKLAGAYTLNGSQQKMETGRSFSSSAKDTSAIYVFDQAALTLVDPTIHTTGNTSSQENSSFFGLNAGVLAAKGGKINISGGSITTTGTGANGAFASGEGSEITLKDLNIKATADGGHGVMVSAGGAMHLTNVNMETSGAHGAAIATDRGGGTITARGGSLITSGQGSPGLYSTGTLMVTDLEIDSRGSEAAVIEGQNSIQVTNSNLKSGKLRGVMIYQSFSGDAEGQEGHFSMTGGSLIAAAGPLFYVTNTTAIIELKGVEAVATSGVLLEAGAGRWGRRGSNGGNALFTAEDETLEGNFICDKGSSINANLKNSTLAGTISGASLSLDANSKWTVTGDSKLEGFVDPQGVTGDSLTNIVGNGHEVRYNPELAANSWLGGKTYNLSGGGHLSPAR